MDGTYGIISLLPVLVLIVVALITKRTFESLLIATLLALVIGYKGAWFPALVEQLQTVAAENIWVLLVVGLLGGLVGVLEKSRAAMGFSGLLSRFATTKKKSLLAEWALSVLLFVDDYLNILTTASITKRLNDSHRVHRTMTAYIIGSTSAPVVVLIPLSSWSIYYASLIESTGIVPEGGSGVLAYIQSIPFMFYPMFCLLVLLLVIAGIIPLFGPIRKYQKQAEETGQLYPDARPAEEETVEEPSGKTGGVLDFVLPILVLLAATIYFNIDVLSGVAIALVFTCIMYLARKLMSISEFVDTVWEGFSTMVSVLALLVIAFLFKAACENLGMSEYIIGKVAPLMAGQVLPFAVFLVATLMTFALANAWGVSAIMVPLIVPLAQAMDANLAVAIAAIFSGSVFGTQLCFYSDNAILIGQATDILPLDHVKTQMPFALCAGILTSIAYLAYGFLFLG
ncbi:MAG: Na+/H+ antiporter NhaC family protein [Bacillota bacterium]|nr:Na+/H+ antiporter NhaC family protein [Bacillota bacterium]